MFGTPNNKRLVILQDSHSKTLSLPASPGLVKLGYGTGVSVLLYERSPKNSVPLSPWALKKVNKKNAKGPIGQRLEEEASLLKNLSHPHIIGFRAYRRNNDGTRVLAIENGGRSLFDIIESRQNLQLPSFSSSIIQKIICSIASALSYLHNEVKLLHGDIKSGNILVIRDFENIKLCDFGVSCRLDENLFVLQGQKYIGTEAWCPKEVLDKKDNISHKADIFSFGCLIYEVLACEPPHVNKLPDSNETLDEEEDYDDFEYQKALGTRPELPENLSLDDSFERILSIYYGATEENPILRPSANTILEIMKDK